MRARQANDSVFRGTRIVIADCDLRIGLQEQPLEPVDVSRLKRSRLPVQMSLL